MVVHFICSLFGIFAIGAAIWIAIALFYGSESLIGEYEEETWTSPPSRIARHPGNSHQRRIARRKLARAQKLGKA